MVHAGRTGWIFRAYPGPYKAYLETPDGKCELVKIYSKGEVPRLRDVSALIREESQVRLCPEHVALEFLSDA